IRAGSAGVCHGDWPGEVRFLSATQTRQVGNQREFQNHPHADFQTRIKEPMETQSQNETVINLPRGKALKIFGVGTAGINILQQVSQGTLTNTTLVALNTDAQSFANSSAAEKICLESRLTRGLGTGGDPERGRATAEEQREVLKAAC